MTFEGQIPILYINLDRRADRRERMQAQFDALGVRAQRIAATNGAEMTPEQIAARSPEAFSKLFTRPLSLGEIACYDSHLRAYDIILRNQWPWACVLEDDVELDPAFADWARVPGPLDALPDRCGILKIEAWEGAPGRTGCAVRRIEGRDVIVFVTPSLGSAGYFISRKGAERMLRHAAIADEPFDHVLGMNWRHGAEMLELSPRLAWQRAEDSNIADDGSRGWQGSRKDWRRARRRAASAGYRIIRRECGVGAAFRLWAGRKLERWRKGRV